MISKAFGSFLGAAVLTSLATQICGTTDAIIMSQLIGPNAMSAINLCSPIFSAVLSLIPLLCMGSSMRVALAIGNQKLHEAKEIFTTTILAALAMALVFGSVIYALRDTFTHLVCPDETIYPYAKEYLSAWLVGLPIFMINNLLYNFVSVDGKPKLVSRAVIVSSCANIALDIVFVKYLNMGIAGGAWATIVSMIFGIGVMCTHLFSKGCSYSLVNVTKVFWKQLWGTFKKGYTFTLNMLIMSAGNYLLNSIILNSLGSTGIFTWSVCAQVTVLSSMAINGAAEALFSIGGVLTGEGDMEGVSRLYQRSQRVMSTLVGVFIVIVMCIPTMLGSLFGADTPELKEATANPIRLFALSVLPLSVAGMARNIYMLLGHGSFVSAMTFVQMGVQILVLWVCSLINPPLIWVGIPVAACITLGIQAAIAWFVSRKDKFCNHFSLISTLPNDPNFNVSVPYDEGKLEESMDEIKSFLTVCDMNEDVTYRILLNCEELLHNIIEHAHKAKEAFFDVHLTEKEDRILLVVKDNDKPFNPIKSFEAGTDLDQLIAEDESDTRLRFFNATCNQIEYKYLYGQNVEYLTWMKEE